jgi:hypothetical protein
VGVEGPPLSRVVLDGDRDLRLSFPLGRGLSTLVVVPPPAARLAVEEVQIRGRHDR